ncbi:MAG: FtsW/RodA/SpoVE family cell cycle protein, partial [Trebonia sp.]
MTMPSPALNGQPMEAPADGRRSTEMWMTLFACGIVLFAFLNVAGSLKDQHLGTIFEYMVAFLVIVLGAHLAIRRWAPYADPLLLPIATVLNGLGIVMIYRLNQVGRNGNPSNGGPISTLGASATTTQIIYSVLGVVVLVAFLGLVKDIKITQPYTYVLGLAGLVLIGLPAILPSSVSGVAGTNAKIQISLGGFSIQPEEFGKLLLAASFASYLVVNGKKLSLLTEKWWIFSLPRRRDLAPILVVWALSMLLLIFE